MYKLVLNGVSKSYGPTHALRKGDFALSAGEAHALVGTNGSGKSTLCKIIAGSIKSDTGTFLYDNQKVNVDSPSDAKRIGIGIFYQELSLSLNRTIAENIFISQLPTRYGLVDKKALNAQAEKYIAMVRDVAGKNFAAESIVADLRADQKQLVEILKTLATESEVLIFDEPTSALDRSQVACFFSILTDLKKQGRALIMISHRMDEIFEICERITVIRDGCIISTQHRNGVSAAQVISLMVGEQGATTLEDDPQPRHSNALQDDLVRVNGLCSESFQDVHFTLNKGEVLGFGGLHGQGQSAVLRALFGTVAISSGDIFHEGKKVSLANPRAAIKQGCAYVSGNRTVDGVILGRSIFENSIPVHCFISSLFQVSPTQVEPKVKKALAQLSTKYHALVDPIDALSGGNQQKVVIARWLLEQPQILLLDDPTKGIDLSAKAELFSLVHQLADAGVGIILYSSDDAELLNNADRILVFNGGAVRRELNGDDRTRFNLYDAAYEGVV